MICYTLSEPTLSGCLKQIEQNREYIDICELRLDLLDEDEQKNAHLFPELVDIPVILTLRP